jgi:hypothetical protein
MRLNWKNQKLQHIRLANRVFASRMPVILPEQHHAAWLGEIENGNLKDFTGPLPCRPDANVGNFSAGKQPEE